MRRPYPFDQFNHTYDCVTNQLDPSNVSRQFNRKRQRRQAAGIVVESLWSNGGNNTASNSSNNNKTKTTPTRKSTAQPRPVCIVAPRGIGPISEPNENDVLCGRGGRINSHSGNVQFRNTIHSKKEVYLAPTTMKLDKAHIASRIVNDIRSMDPPGRFLKEEKAPGSAIGVWYDIGDQKAIKKTGQALREDAPDIRPPTNVDDGSSGDEKKPSANKMETIRGPRVPVSAQPAGVFQKSTDTTKIRENSQDKYTVGGHLFTNYDAQRSMPPPLNVKSNNPPGFSYDNNNNLRCYLPMEGQYHQEYLQEQQRFQTRNIPLQVPPQQEQPFFPNQLYSGVQRAMGALSQPGTTAYHQQQWAHLQQARQPVDDVVFNRTFRTTSDCNTNSTISNFSALSDPMSSTLGSGTVTANSLMNISMKSGLSLTNNSLRMSRGGNSIKTRDSFMSGSFRRSSLTPSIERSNSFSDMHSFSKGANNWKDEGQLASWDDLPEWAGSGPRNLSAMSIEEMFDDMSSNASSRQYLSMLGHPPPPEMMSQEIDALDLASG